MKKMALVLALAMLLADLAGAAAEEGCSAVEFARKLGNGTNLGNTLEACDASRGMFSDDPLDYERLWGQPETTREMLFALKAAGFDTLRIPVAWMTNATRLPEGDCTIAPAYLDRVEQVVAWALDAGLYVILNDHWDGGWWGMFGSDTAAVRERAMEAYVRLWSQIAGRFAGYDERLVLEGANEELGARFDEDSALYCRDSAAHPLSDGERYTLTNRVNQAFVDTVRFAGGFNATRFLLIPGYGTNIDKTCDDRFVMPRDTVPDRLLVSVHYYDPWSYCGASSAAGATRWGTKKDLRDMNAQLAKMQKFTSAGYGVVIGEYGALPGSDGQMKDNAVLYHRNFLLNCDLYGYCGCLWDTSGFFAREKLAFSDEAVAALYDGMRYAPGDTPPDEYAARVSRDAGEKLQSLIGEAPETFRENPAERAEHACVAWIMWSSSDWALSYSVGDTYSPDTVSPGIRTTDAVIDGPGTYTVALDFTGTEKGYSASTAFSALGIAEGERLHPGWAVHIQEMKINGRPYRMTARPYTTSDDGRCTRVNLFNEWVTALPADARVLYGPNISIAPVVIDRGDPVFSRVETIEITFVYGEKR